MFFAITHPRRRLRTLLAAATVASAAAAFGTAADAGAASYYNIVNTNTGRALEASIDNKVRLAAPDKGNLLQQWKQIYRVNFGSWYEVALQNRLTGCLRSDTINPESLAPLTVGVCDGAQTDSRKRWSHLSGSVTGSPTVPGAQLVNSQTAEYTADFDLCFFGNCSPKPGASLMSASGVASDPNELGGIVKWRYKFAATAP